MTIPESYLAGCTYRGLFPAFHARLANRKVERELNHYEVETDSFVQRTGWTSAAMFIRMTCTRTRLDSIKTLLHAYGFDILDSEGDVFL